MTEDQKQRRREARKKWRDANPDYNKQYRQQNKEAVRAVKRKYREANKEKYDEYMQLYREANKDRIKQHREKHYQENKQDYYVRNAIRRTKTETQDELTEFVFKEALELCVMREKVTRFAWHVDHIVPLQHKDACGLHSAVNFQVVPARWNLSKRNRNMKTYFPV